MSRQTVDLSICDREPIHLIGAIQPHGALIAVDEKSLTIQFASTNTQEFIECKPEEILDKDLASVLGESNCKELSNLPLIPSTPELLKPWFVQLPSGKNVECLPHKNNGQLILEFYHSKPSPATVWEEENLRQKIISELIKPDALEELTQVSADIIRQVTGIDRVMIYKFAEDKHGEVIAESTDRSDSFLGLHYPASDIPEPARRHFVLNVIRSIPDINAPAVSIIGSAGVALMKPATNP